MKSMRIYDYSFLKNSIPGHIIRPDRIPRFRHFYLFHVLCLISSVYILFLTETGVFPDSLRSCCCIWRDIMMLCEALRRHGMKIKTTTFPSSSTFCRFYTGAIKILTRHLPLYLLRKRRRRNALKAYCLMPLFPSPNRIF